MHKLLDCRLCMLYNEFSRFPRGSVDYNINTVTSNKKPPFSYERGGFDLTDIMKYE